MIYRLIVWIDCNVFFLEDVRKQSSSEKEDEEGIQEKGASEGEEELDYGEEEDAPKKNEDEVGYGSSRNRVE